MVVASTDGLGLAVARALSQEGVRVLLCGRNSETAKAEAALLENAVGVGIDLAEADSPDRLMALA